MNTQDMIYIKVLFACDFIILSNWMMNDMTMRIAVACPAHKSNIHFSR